MISKKLQQARDYEREHMGSISPQDRPVFHITPGIGWLNDRCTGVMSRERIC